MKSLKILLTVTLLFTFGVMPNANAQHEIGDGELPGISENPLLTQPVGRNMISCNSYTAIKYNGYTISQINASSGDVSNLQSQWGVYSSVETDQILGSETYYYGQNYAHFYDNELTKLEIKDAGWPLTVLGKSIRVGNSFASLQQKFGDDLKIINKPSISNNYIVSFNCLGNGYDGLLIYLNPLNHEVVEIVYYVNP